MSTKYQGLIKRMPIPHVLVFLNELPEEGILSDDRVRVLEIKSDKNEFTMHEPLSGTGYKVKTNTAPGYVAQ